LYRAYLPILSDWLLPPRSYRFEYFRERSRDRDRDLECLDSRSERLGERLLRLSLLGDRRDFLSLSRLWLWSLRDLLSLSRLPRLSLSWRLL
jgi:hypothetical protein